MVVLSDGDDGFYALTRWPESAYGDDVSSWYGRWPDDPCVVLFNGSWPYGGPHEDSMMI